MHHQSNLLRGTTHKTIGIVGGLSPESTANYYQMIVRQHFEFFADRYYPPIIIKSVSYQQYTDWRLNNQWEVIAEHLTQEFIALANAGADFALVACNTMHKVLPQVQSPIPILSIVDAAAAEAQRLSLNTLILTGTGFTMSDGFLAQQLSPDIPKVLTPDSSGQRVIEKIIRTELTLGKVSQKSVDEFSQVINDTLQGENLHAEAQSCGVLLACTELGMLIPHLPSTLNYIDTAYLHAMSAWKISTGQLPSYRVAKALVSNG